MCDCGFDFIFSMVLGEDSNISAADHN